MQSTPSTPATSVDLIDRQITDELNRARKKHGAFFKGGASAPPLTEREKLPTPVLIIRQHRNSRTHNMVGFLRPFDPSFDRAPIKTVEQAAELARANRWHLRCELDKPDGYPLPRAKATEVSADQITAWEAEQAAKAEPAAA